MGRRRVAVLISGSGTNLQALLDATRSPDASAEIVLVISNRADAYGLKRADSAGIPSLTVEHGAYPTRDAFEAAINAALDRSGIELVCLAGFMRVLTAGFVSRWRDRLINIHPSLLPAFPGLHTHARALAAGVQVSGCTVHAVRAEVDQGPILVQGVVPVHDHDTPETLGARVLEIEHRAYPLALELLAAGRLGIAGERVVASDAAAEAARLLLHPALAEN